MAVLQCTPALREFAFNYIPRTSAFHIVADDRADRLEMAIRYRKFTALCDLKDVLNEQLHILKFLLLTPYLGLDPSRFLLDAVESGNITVLSIVQWILQTGLVKSIPDFDLHGLSDGLATLDNVSKNKHIAIFKEWRMLGIKLDYTSFALDYASAQGHTDVVEWWLSSGLEVKYTDNAFRAANAYGHDVVLADWRAHGYKIRV
ncbi:hypothetical protein H9P43_009388 [Blastocladiella emersonii ATCC 22665]|nr:hypothetical protein H9P43_009388 [Blastocladiella emersonii ATCC 22665]